MSPKNDRLLRACRLLKVDRTPVWLMRQAGRYMPEYRKLREKYNILTLCRTPELAAEVTMMPIKRFDLDAAILFSDIMVPLTGAGVKVDINENVGPVISKPIREVADIKKIRQLNTQQDIPYIVEAINITLSRLDGSIPLIGFAGAPFTLASYLIEGGSSRSFAKTKSFMYCQPDAWQDLMERLACIVSEFLLAQIRAGVHVVQLFDSWSGCLAAHDYKKYVFPYSKMIFDEVRRTNVPSIHFGTVTSELLELMRDAGGNVIGVDWRVDIAEAWRRTGDGVGIQGNLDPAVLLSDASHIQSEAVRIMKKIGGRKGHIFNLGHGVLPDTPVDNVAALVESVHNFGVRTVGSYER